MSTSSSRDALLAAGWALIEALTIAAVVVTVGATLPAGAPRPATAPLLLLMVLVTLGGRASLRWRARPVLGRLLALALATGLGFAWLRHATPPAVSPLANASLGMLAVSVAGRGLLIGLRQPAHADVMRAFLRGVVVLMGLFALLSLADVPIDGALRDTLRAQILGYFALGPAVVALAQRRDLDRARGVRTAASASWLLAVMVPIGSVLALALLVSAGAGGVRDVLTLTSHVAETALALVAQALRWVAYAGVAALAWIGSLFPGGGRRAVPPPPLSPREFVVDEPLVSLPPATIPVGQHDVAAPVALLTVALFATLYVSKLLRTPTEADDPFGADEERASLWSWALFLRQARDLLRAVRTRAGTVGGALRAREGRHGSSADVAELGSVRGVYRALLRWAERRGGPRAPATTPHELSHDLAVAGDQRGHLDALTAIYTEARYGAHPPTPERIAEARAHLMALTAPETEAPAPRPSYAPDAARDPDPSA